MNDNNIIIVSVDISLILNLINHHYQLINDHPNLYGILVITIVLYFYAM